MPTVLVIDDDDAAPFTIATAVPDWTLIAASDGLAGLELLRQQRDTIDLVVLDMAMPDLDGIDTCLQIRALAPQLPILPFTGIYTADTNLSLRELHCAEPVYKPVALPVLAAALHSAIGSQPAPLPASGVRSRAQRGAADRERQARITRTVQVLMCAERRRDRVALKHLILAAGLAVPLDTPHLAVLDQYVRRAARTGEHEQQRLLATTADNALSLATYAAERALPLLVIALSLADALRLADQIHTAPDQWPIVGLVVDHPDDDTRVPPQIAAITPLLLGGETVILASLERPFADAPLSPHEQTVLALEIQGRDSAAIALHMGIDGSTVRKYRGRIREKAGLDADAPIAAWGEQWWFAHAPR